MIEVKNLKKVYGDRAVISGVSVSFEKGKVVALIGPSGGGKSTLLRCINGLEDFQGGEIHVGGEVLDVMRALANDGLTMLVVTHEMKFAREVSHRTLVLHGGAIIEDGPSHDVIERPTHERTKAFLGHTR